MVLMPQLPRDDKDTGYAGDIPTSITSMRNMKSHLKRKMRMDEIHPDNVTDDEMTNFLISSFGFSREFCARSVEEWRYEL